MHHYYCDIIINESDVALLELVATESKPTLKEHCKRAHEYAAKLCPKEVWIVHFSRGDSIASEPYWPPDELQMRGLKIVHFWHDEDFKQVLMSYRYWDATTETFHETLNEEILRY